LHLRRDSVRMNLQRGLMLRNRVSQGVKNLLRHPSRDLLGMDLQGGRMAFHRALEGVEDRLFDSRLNLLGMNRKLRLSISDTLLQRVEHLLRHTRCDFLGMSLERDRVLLYNALNLLQRLLCFFQTFFSISQTAPGIDELVLGSRQPLLG